MTADGHTKGSLIRVAIHMLMEATPDEINPKEILSVISSVDDVTNAHDLHVWALAEDMFALTVHVKCKPGSAKRVLKDVDSIVRNKFHINHLTI